MEVLAVGVVEAIGSVVAMGLDSIEVAEVYLVVAVRPSVVATIGLELLRRLKRR